MYSWFTLSRNINWEIDSSVILCENICGSLTIRDGALFIISHVCYFRFLYFSFIALKGLTFYQNFYINKYMFIYKYIINWLIVIIYRCSTGYIIIVTCFWWIILRLECHISLLWNWRMNTASLPTVLLYVYTLLRNVRNNYLVCQLY